MSAGLVNIDSGRLNDDDWFNLIGHELSHVTQAQDKGLLLYLGAGTLGNTALEHQADSIGGTFCYPPSLRGC
jgi:hypothetical protein